MGEPEPEWFAVWIARALFLAGLWFAGTGLWDVFRKLPSPWDDLLVHLPGIGAGLFFLWGAWRMRAVLRWYPPGDE